MKQISLLMLLLLTGFYMARAADIKTMTYNIHHGNPPASSGINLTAVANVILAAAPDLVALQEVDKNTTRSGNVNQAAVLAGLTGMNYYFSKSIDYQGGEYGVAILSKYPIVESYRFQLPMAAGAGGEARSVAVVAVMVNGQKVYFACTHFDTIAANQLLQAQAVADTAAGKTLPFILAGDLNALPQSQPITTLKSQFTPGCTSCQYTSSAAAPSKTIDYILFNQPALQRYYIKEYAVVNEPLVSDHLPVTARLALHPGIIQGWQFANPQTAGNEVNIAATRLHANLDPSSISRGAGLRRVNNADAEVKLSRGFVSASVYSSSSALSDTSVAIANNMYFGFTVKPKSNNTVSLSSIDYKIRISAGGAKTWYWTYSTNGINFRKVAAPVILTGATDTEGAIQQRIHLSPITELRNIPAGTTIYFRVYVSGANNTTGTTAIGRTAAGDTADYSLAIGGTVQSTGTFATQPALMAGSMAATHSNSQQAVTVQLVANQLMVRAYADQGVTAAIQLTDMAGRSLLLKQPFLQQGENRFSYPLWLAAGVYVVNVSYAGKRNSIKIIK